MKKLERAFCTLLAALLLASSLTSYAQPYSSNKVVVVKVNGEIVPAVERSLTNALSYAKSTGARLFVVELNTSGGLASCVENLMVAFENSNVPVCVYIYPRGARAWSGGTYLLMASHIAAMASGTTIGSCQPVEETPSGVKPISDEKYINALSELLVNHARLHSRNEEVAKRFVTENLNLGPSEALSMGVVELVADDLNELLHKLEGYVLIEYLGSGGERVWKLVPRTEAASYEAVQKISFEGISHAQVEELGMGLGEIALSILQQPLVATLLLTLGLLLLIIGIKTPGYGAELFGAICIVLGLMALGELGVNIAAAILMALGLALIGVELKKGIGALGVAGALCIVLGGLLLMPSYQWMISPEALWRIWISTLLLGLFVASVLTVVVYKVAVARKQKVLVGADALLGEEGVCTRDIDPAGEVRVMGQIWRAKSVDRAISRGERVRVVGRDGLMLLVKPVEE